MAILQGLIRYSLLTKRSITFPTATPIKSSITKKMKNLVVLCLLWFLLQLVTTSLLNLHVYYITGHPVAFGWLENSDRKNSSHVHVADRYLNNERLVLSEVQVSLRNFLENGGSPKRSMYKAFSATLRLIQESPKDNHNKTGALVVGDHIMWLAECITKDLPWTTIKHHCLSLCK